VFKNIKGLKEIYNFVLHMKYMRIYRTKVPCYKQSFVHFFGMM